jgi:putative ABC transport system permease protein
VALGARPGDVSALVLQQGLKLVAPGMALGLAGALASTRLLGSWLYGVRATDASAFAIGALLLSAAALAACAAPARRAARLDPMVALRDE